MVELRDGGQVPRADRGAQDWATGRPFAFKLLSLEAPSSLSPGEDAPVCLHLRNIGARPWLVAPKDGRPTPALAVSLAGRSLETVRLRHDVWPTGTCHFAFSVRAPAGSGPHELRMELFDDSPAIVASIQ
jgi:hypothetical protein